MKKNPSDTGNIDPKIDQKKRKPVKHLATELPIAEKDEVKQAEDRLRERIQGTRH